MCVIFSCPFWVLAVHGLLSFFIRCRTVFMSKNLNCLCIMTVADSRCSLPVLGSGGGSVTFVNVVILYR